MIGTNIGPYRITGELGEGGMGVVYRATDNIEREVAIKALHAHLTRDESRLQRFRSEAVALGRLHHPNIATLFALHEQNGAYYMVMEFVQGETLEDLVKRNGALPLKTALELFCDALRGFEHAHARGVIHRDIKPSNLMLSRDGTVKITDFGIARMAGSGRMTQTGKLIGTLEYMSPEQVRGLEQDARSDIYSLGILLFELVTGRIPFSSTSDFDLMRAQLEDAAPPARTFVADLPPALDAVLQKSLAKDPNARFQSVGEMRGALEEVTKTLSATSPGAASFAASPTSVASFASATENGASLFASTTQTVPPKTPVVEPPAPALAAPLSAPANSSKKMAPLLAFLGAGGAMLAVLTGLFALRPASNVTPDPTPLASTIEKTDETPDSSQNFTNSGAIGQNNGDKNELPLPGIDPTPAPKRAPEFEIPDSIPGFGPEPTPISQPRVEVRPAPTRAPRSVATPKIERPPTPRRVVRRRPATIKRIETPRPKRARVVKTRVAKPIRKRQTRVVARPSRPARPSPNRSEAAILRDLIKGN